MPQTNYWSKRVMQTSNALDLPKGIFLKDAHHVALDLKRSAHASTRRKSGEFRSAMSMLNFEINRAGRGMPASRKHELEKAKEELRRLYGRPTKH